MKLLCSVLLLVTLVSSKTLRGLKEDEVVHDFVALNYAPPFGFDISPFTPVFDFDGDGCLPAAGVSRTGQPNGGLNPSGSITGGCRSKDFLKTSNTYHRSSCNFNPSTGDEHCVFMFALYFEKDQTTELGGGHRHDWENVAVWAKNRVITHGSYSAHGNMYTTTVNNIDKQNGKLKFVYHKEGLLTHAMRFAKQGEVAENEYKTFVTPPVVDWYTMKGDTVSNSQLRNILSTHSYGSAVFPNKDNRFFGTINEYRPSGYPPLTSFEVLHDFQAKDRALPLGIDISPFTPVFDFDGDGCLPAVGVSRTGQPNGGLNPSGSITGGCRSKDFLKTSNTYHRHICLFDFGVEYCAFMFALYFEKDQTTELGGGHRHDWENVVVWTTNRAITHGSYSAHGNLYTTTVNNIDKQNGKLKFVYHKEGLLTHAMRFAKKGEVAENEYRTFVTPPVVDWFTMKGDTVSNSQLRQILSTHSYGSGTFPNKDDQFFLKLNKHRPSGYPYLAQLM